MFSIATTCGAHPSVKVLLGARIESATLHPSLLPSFPFPKCSLSGPTASHGALCGTAAAGGSCGGAHPSQRIIGAVANIWVRILLTSDEKSRVGREHRLGSGKARYLPKRSMVVAYWNRVGWLLQQD